jgi:chemotaxis protein CheD
MRALAPRVHTLHPGHVVCADAGETLETLLGSCIAVIMTDPRRTLGAMCHIVHASPDQSPTRSSATHADTALRHMFEQLLQRGSVPRLCEAYVYGGGNMFPELFPRRHVGASNASVVLEGLAAENVRVLVQDVGGPTYRRLRWTVGPGLPQVTAVEV